ncbi:MAG TPA: alpha/beta hydrolase [Myxococcales bacterium]
MPFVQIPQLRVHYETAGQGPSPVVLIHGNFASARWWRPVLERCPEGVTVFAPSSRGCGDSERLREGFNLPQLAKDVADFATALGLSRLRVLGHSLGGAVAMQLAADFPDRIDSLLVIAPPPTAAAEVLKDKTNPLARILRAFNADDPKDVMMIKALLAWGEAFGMHRRMLRRSLEDMLGKASVAREQIDAMLDDAAKVPEEALLGFLSALQHWDIRPQLAKVTAPATVMWGENDPLIGRESAEAAAQNFANGRLLVWAGIGHSPMFERPDEFAALVGAFARGEPLPAAL